MIFLWQITFFRETFSRHSYCISETDNDTKAFVNANEGIRNNVLPGTALMKPCENFCCCCYWLAQMVMVMIQENL